FFCIWWKHKGWTLKDVWYKLKDMAERRMEKLRENRKRKKNGEIDDSAFLEELEEEEKPFRGIRRLRRKRRNRKTGYDMEDGIEEESGSDEDGIEEEKAGSVEEDEVEDDKGGSVEE
ncbi:MAG: hypothetical protein HFH87_14435, partial [Lachnospiraceae bacterium]|nr:hypothetical protein [Lachnospiraceae bacterium]